MLQDMQFRHCGKGARAALLTLALMLCLLIVKPIAAQMQGDFARLHSGAGASANPAPSSSDFNSTFNNNANGWSPVTGTWMLVSPGYYATEGLENTSASATHTGAYGDFTYQVKMYRTGTCTACANRLILRGKPASLTNANWWRPSYVFQYTNDGFFSVYRSNKNGQPVALANWKGSNAIVKNGWNKLKVVAAGPSMAFYINNKLVWSGLDSKYLTGKVGFGMYRDSAAGTLDVDWAKLSTTQFATIATAAPVEEVEPSAGTMDQSP